jgi:HlyD family secretion protein
VLVLDGGRAAPRAVRTGIRTLQAVEVIEGLADGDVVLLDAGLSPGQRVRARPPRPAASAAGEGVSQAMQGFSR